MFDFPRESAADEDEESGSGQTVYADFDFAMCSLIGGRLMLDYDGNMHIKTYVWDLSNQAFSGGQH